MSIKSISKQKKNNEGHVSNYFVSKQDRKG